jgi:hypothetical protein
VSFRHLVPARLAVFSQYSEHPALDGNLRRRNIDGFATLKTNDLRETEDLGRIINARNDINDELVPQKFRKGIPLGDAHEIPLGVSLQHVDEAF